MRDKEGTNSDILRGGPPKQMSATAIGALLRLGEIYGLSGQELRARCGLQEKTGWDPDRSYSYRVGLTLWRVLLEQAPKAHLGLEFADLALASERDLLRHLLHHSRTFGDGLERFIEFQHLVDSGSPVQLHGGETSGESQLLVQPLPLGLASNQPMESLVASVFNLCRALIGRKFQVRAVEFRHAQERAVGPYLDFFGVAPRFQAEQTGLSFASTLLDLPVEGALPGLEPHLAAQAKVLAADREKQERQQWEGRVRKVCLAQGLGLRLDDVAQHLGVSGRTLQRRLSEEGCSFEAILADLQQSELQLLLRDRELSLDEIAYRLGFRDRRSLQRAYRRWTGEGSLMRARAMLRGG